MNRRLFWRLILGGFLFEAFVAGGVSAKAETLTLTKGEVQNLVYTSHLLRVVDQHPEMEAALVALLELHRRNPEVEPHELAGQVSGVLATYRQEYPDGEQGPPPRDELMATFFELLAKEPGLVGGRPATLSLLINIVEDSYTAVSDNSKLRLHAGNEEILSLEHAMEKQQTEVEAIVLRAKQRPDFEHCLNGLMESETGVLFHQYPVKILELDPLLASSPTIDWLSELHGSIPPEGVQIDVDQLKLLFEEEMAALKVTIVENQALHKQMEASQDDLAAYLDNPERIAANVALQSASQEGQEARIAVSTAAAHSLSFIMRESHPGPARHMRTLSNSMSKVASGLRALDTARKFSKLAACTDFLSAGLGLVSIFFDMGPSPEEMILEEINALKQMIADLAHHVDYRFDRVDRLLGNVLDKLDESIQLIGEVAYDVDQVRWDLLDVQAQLCRLERNIHSYMEAEQRGELIALVDANIGYEWRTGDPMPWDVYKSLWGESAFYTYAVTKSANAISCPQYSLSDLEVGALYDRLNNFQLESNLNYINAFLNQALGLPSLASGPVANPRDWFMGADAYLKLAMENPLHFRRINRTNLDYVVNKGRDIEDFLRAITLSGSAENPQLNSQLFEAVLNFYSGELGSFNDAMVSLEVEHGEDMELDVLSWREWDEEDNPVYEVDETVVESNLVRMPRIPDDIVQVAAGSIFSLALRSNGTVVAWGSNGDQECEIPEGLTDVIAISAGVYHSLALRSDGTVVAWGYNAYGQCDVPEGLDDVIAISAGAHHNLALRGDGTVVAWGYLSNYIGAVPEGLSDVVAIAAGGDSNRDLGAHNLALKGDGTVVAWGSNGYGECNVPVGLSGVVGIAAGQAQSAAVLSDGSVVGWPGEIQAEGNVVALSIASYSIFVALLEDGSIEVIQGPTEGAPDSNDIVGVSVNSSHILAVHNDGQISAWGNPRYGQCRTNDERAIVRTASTDDHLLLLMDDGSVQIIATSYSSVDEVPVDLPPVVAIAAGLGKGTSPGSSHAEAFNLALTEDGTVVAWGGNTMGQCNVPEGLTNVVAVAASEATDGGHSLALQKDGTVVAWGANAYGQCNVPGDLDDAVAIAAGWRHSAALRANGTVRVWGDSWSDVKNVPSGLSDVVAISSRFSHMLALKKDGTVVAWGSDGNNYGQINVPGDLSDVVAIDAGVYSSLALKADGTVVGWGYWQPEEELTGVYSMSCGGRYGAYFLMEPDVPNIEGTGPYSLARKSQYSAAVSYQFSQLYQKEGFLADFDLDLVDPGRDLAGAKALIEAIVSLGLPQSLGRDDALRGFLLGTESIPDKEGIRSLYGEEAERLAAGLWAHPRNLGAVLHLRLDVFASRLWATLQAIEDSGRPEIPRMLRHTLTLLEVLKQAHLAGQSPAPILDGLPPADFPGSVSYTLYGEPFIHYDLEHSLDLSNWESNIDSINDGDVLSLQIPLGEGFYRVCVPSSE